MDINTRIKMRSKARLTKGLMNILFDDIERISNEKDSIQDAKGTLQCLLDNIVELEYSVYLSNRGTRE